jgi:hypothetical protein
MELSSRKDLLFFTSSSTMKLKRGKCIKWGSISMAQGSPTLEKEQRTKNKEPPLDSGGASV